MPFEARATRVPSRYSVKLPPSEPKRYRPRTGAPENLPRSGGLVRPFCSCRARSQQRSLPRFMVHRPKKEICGSAHVRIRLSLLMQIVSTARRGENLARQSPVGLATALPKPGRRTVLILEGLGQRKPRAREICALARNASCARPLIVSRAHAREACEQLQPAKPCHEPVLGRERTRNVEMSSRRYEMTT